VKRVYNIMDPIDTIIKWASSFLMQVSFSLQCFYAYRLLSSIFSCSIVLNPLCIHSPLCVFIQDKMPWKSFNLFIIRNLK
jgi:hypothetical protein